MSAPSQRDVARDMEKAPGYWYDQGRTAMETASRDQIQRGSVWNADQLRLKGEARTKFIQGFHDALVGTRKTKQL